MAETTTFTLFPMNLLIRFQQTQSPFAESEAEIETNCEDIHFETLDDDSAVMRVFVEAPPWMSSFLSAANKSNQSDEISTSQNEYNTLKTRQIKTETEAWESEAEEYRKFEREMCEKKLAPNLPYVKSLFLGWFPPLREAISNEQKLQEAKKQKATYAHHIALLPVDKMAVIFMHKMMGLLMIGHDDVCVRVVQAAVHIGEAVENEVRIHKIAERIKKFRSSWIWD